jgi:hypothetical protein
MLLLVDKVVGIEADWDVDAEIDSIIDNSNARCNNASSSSSPFRCNWDNWSLVVVSWILASSTICDVDSEVEAPPVVADAYHII